MAIFLAVNFLRGTISYSKANEIFVRKRDSQLQCARHLNVRNLVGAVASILLRPRSSEPHKCISGPKWNSPLGLFTSGEACHRDLSSASQRMGTLGRTRNNSWPCASFWTQRRARRCHTRPDEGGFRIIRCSSTNFRVWLKLSCCMF